MSEKNNIPKSHGRFDTVEDGEEFVNIEEKEDQIQNQKEDKEKDEEKNLKEKKEQAKQVARQNLE